MTQTTTLPPNRRTPNFVSTQAPAGPHRMEPIPYTGSRAQAQERLAAVLRGLPRTRIVEEKPGHLKVECRSRVFRFVDDLVLVFDETARQIHFHSAARLGRRDFGVNRKRMDEIRRLFLTAGDEKT